MKIDNTFYHILTIQILLYYLVTKRVNSSNFHFDEEIRKIIMNVKSVNSTKVFDDDVDKAF